MQEQGGKCQAMQQADFVRGPGENAVARYHLFLHYLHFIKAQPSIPLTFTERETQ